jgi:hypothetical protein
MRAIRDKANTHYVERLLNHVFPVYGFTRVLEYSLSYSSTTRVINYSASAALSECTIYRPIWRLRTCIYMAYICTHEINFRYLLSLIACVTGKRVSA